MTDEEKDNRRQSVGVSPAPPPIWHRLWRGEGGLTLNEGAAKALASGCDAFVHNQKIFHASVVCQEVPESHYICPPDETGPPRE